LAGEDMTSGPRYGDLRTDFKGLGGKKNVGEEMVGWRAGTGRDIGNEPVW